MPRFGELAPRSTTYVVAASDSVHTDAADYVCDGTADNVEIQAALDALPSTGGEVICLEGNYRFAAAVAIGGGGSTKEVLRFLGSSDSAFVAPSGNTNVFNIARNGHLYGAYIRTDSVGGYSSSVIRFTTPIAAPGVVVENLSLIGTAGAGTGSALDLSTSGSGEYITYIVGDNIYIQGYEYGFNVTGSFTGAPESSIFLNNFTNVRFNNVRNAIFVSETGANNPIHGNRFVNFDMQWGASSSVMITCLASDKNDFIGNIYDRGGAGTVATVSGRGNRLIFRDASDSVFDDISDAGQNNYIEDIYANAWSFGGSVIANTFGPAGYVSRNSNLHVANMDDFLAVLPQFGGVLASGIPTGAISVVPFAETSGSGATDYSGTSLDMTLIASPTRTRMQQLGAVTLNGTSQGAQIESDGIIRISNTAFTLILVCSPNAAYTENATRTFLRVYYDEANYLYLYKDNNAGGNVMRFGMRGTFQPLGEPITGNTTVPFLANDKLIFVITKAADISEVSVYCNGERIIIPGNTGDFGAAIIQGTGSQTYEIGMNFTGLPAGISAGWFAGDIAFSAILRHFASADEVRSITASLANLIGLVLERSGTGTITTGTTSLVITHGLGYQPLAESISITPTNNPTNNPGNIWVDTITRTQFTVNCRSDPGASGMIFSWRVS